MGVRAVLVLTMEQMQSRLATTGLIVVASLNIQTTVGVLLLLVRGVRQAGFLHTSMNVVSCITRATSLRSEFVISPVGLSKLIRLSWMYVGHSRRHAKLELS